MSFERSPGRFASRRCAPARAWRGLVIALLLAAVVPVPCAQTAAETPARRDADVFLEKIDRIRNRPTATPAGSTVTTVSQRELTAWLTLDAPAHLPTGVVDPTLLLEADGRVRGGATVDLDSVRTQRRSGGWFDPVNLLRGTVTISAVGILQGKDGVARFVLESASVGAIPIPKSFLQQVVSHYTSTEDDPDGVGLDEAYPMPSGIREIRIESQQAHVVQ